MNVSPDALRKETVSTLDKVNRQLDLIELERGAIRPNPTTAASLLLAKAQCLNTLALLNQYKK